MNFGANLFGWISPQIQQVVLVAILVTGVYFAFKREFTKLIATAIVAIVAVGLTFNTSGAKDVLLSIFNKVIGA